MRRIKTGEEISLDKVDCVVIGAGVVGLAIARQFARKGLETILLERENAFGTVTSARNSEVIHAGIYYPEGSLKAKLCVQGNRLLYEYARVHGVGVIPCGKLIVASKDEQVTDLEQIWTWASFNGVSGMSRLTGKQAVELEPELVCKAALLSSSTGVIDSHAYMLSLLGGFEDAGGMIAYQSPFVGAKALMNGAQGFNLTIASDLGVNTTQIHTKYLINSAGLSAPAIAQKIEGLSADKIPKAYFAKGNYFSFSGKSPFSRLIYPVPEPGGLGVHVTLDRGGQAKFGPDVQWLDIETEDQIDYKVEPMRGDRFYEAVRKYWPGLPDYSLRADYSGVRPKIVNSGEKTADFRLDGPKFHGIEGLVNLFGIESPGLTSSLAIAQEVEELLKDL